VGNIPAAMVAENLAITIDLELVKAGAASH
jgi:hypothetical protein